MGKIHYFEVYDAEGNEVPEKDFYKEAAAFWGVPCEVPEPAGWAIVVPPNEFGDLYFVLVSRILMCKEGLVNYHDLVGMMIGSMAFGMKVYTRSYKMLIDKLAPYIKLIRHWQDKGYKIYSTRWDDEKEPDEYLVKFFKELWEKKCPPSYAKFGDIQDFNPYLDD